MTVRTLAPPSGLIAILAGTPTSPPVEHWRPHALADLNVTELLDNKWRVRNDRLPPDDPAGLLGFIELLAGETVTFEVMTLPGGFTWSSYASLREAIESFVEPGHPAVDR